MTANPRLSQLRHLLHQEPDEPLWRQLCELLDTWPEDHRVVALDYAHQHLSSWPTALRHANPEIGERLDQSPPPWWPLVRSAQLSALNPDSLRRLLSAGHLSHLHHLDLKSNRLGSAGLKLLTQTSHLTQLRALSLAWNGLQPEGALHFTSARLQLRSLDLQMNDVQSPGAEAIARCRALHDLRHLDLSHNAVGPTGTGRLAGSPHMQNLRSLSLANSDRHDAELNLNMLRALCSLPNLRQLDFSNNPTGPDAAEALSRLHNPTHLDLRGCKLQDRGLHDLTHAPAFATVQRLNVAAGHTAQNRDLIPITDASATSLADSPHTQSLRTLSLAGTRLGPDGLYALANSPGLRHLHTLILRHTPLGDDGARQLARAHQLADLRRLDLNSTDIGPGGLRALSRSEHLPALRHLSLSANVRLSVDDLCHFLTTPLGRQLECLEFPNKWLFSIAQERLGPAFPPNLQPDWGQQDHERIPSCALHEEDDPA